MNGEQQERFLTTEDLAHRYGVPVQTIRAWRFYSKGPKGIRLGKYVRYRMADVLEFEASKADPKGAA